MENKNAKTPKFKSIIMPLGLVLTFGLSSPGLTQTRHFSTEVKVIEATPVYEEIVVSKPQRTCFIEEIREPQTEVVYKRHSGLGGAIVGGILGGVLGSSVGRGRRGRRNSAIVGTAIGATVGSAVTRKHRVIHSEQVSEVERCEVRHEQSRIRELQGYDVLYNYRGQSFRTRTPHDPGEYLNVRVEITPVANY